MSRIVPAERFVQCLSTEDLGRDVFGIYWTMSSLVASKDCPRDLMVISHAAHKNYEMMSNSADLNFAMGIFEEKGAFSQNKLELLS